MLVYTDPSPDLGEPFLFLSFWSFFHSDAILYMEERPTSKNVFVEYFVYETGYLELMTFIKDCTTMH